MLLSLVAPPDNDRGPRFMEKAIAAMHQSNDDGESIALIFGEHEGRTGLFLRVSDDMGPIVREFIASKFPQATIDVINNDALELPAAKGFWAEARLSPELFPILRFSQFEDMLTRQYEDPIDALLRSVQDDGHTCGRIEMHVAPASAKRCRKAKQAVRVLERPLFRHHPRLADYYAEHVTRPRTWLLAAMLGVFARPDTAAHSQTEISASRQHDRESDLQAAFDKLGGHLFDAHIHLMIFSSNDTHQHLIRKRFLTMAGALGSLTRSRLATFHVSRIRNGTPPASHGIGFLVSHEEIATMFHPPVAAAQDHRLQTIPHVELHAPREVFDHSESSNTLGLAKYSDDWGPFGIDIDARRRHLHVIGKTGMGKTNLLRNMICQDIAAGRGVGLVDPHGDLADAVLASVPHYRTNDVIILDPSDPDFVVGYNPLACPDPARRDLVVDDIVSALDKIYDFTSMPRATDMLRNALFVLIEKQETLLGLLRFLSDDSDRQRMLRGIEDDVVRLYWDREFPSLDKSARSLTTAAILNKIRPFLLSPRLRAIVGQQKNTIDLRCVLDEQKVLVVNLSKGKLGEGNSRLLGTLLVTGLQQAALSRADIPEHARSDFYLYIDEFHNVVTPSVSTILSEGRKFHLNLTCAHQFMAQLSDPIRDAVFGNVGSTIAFQVGSADAEELATYLSQRPGILQPQHLTGMPKYVAYGRILIDGAPSPPFSIRTLPPLTPAENRRAAVYAASRRQYGHPTAAVQQRLKREFTH